MRAGPKLLAGFMDAPVRGSPAKLSIATMAPMARGASIWLARLSIAVANTTITSRKVSMASSPKPAGALSAGLRLWTPRLGIWNMRWVRAVAVAAPAS